MFPADESVRVEEHPGGEHVGAAAVGVVAHDGVAQPVAVHPACGTRFKSGSGIIRILMYIIVHIATVGDEGVIDDLS